MFKKIKVTNKGVYVLDSDIQNSINKTNLSPSMIGAWLNSPADYILDKYIFPLVKIEDAPHFVRGSWFHKTMEEFYRLPQEERTFANLKLTSKNVITNATKTDGFIDKQMTAKEFSEFVKNPENKEWFKKALKGYAETWLKNAKHEKIATLYLMGEKKFGLELFVKGKLGRAERQCLGFIDKIVEGEMGLIIQDWKTGGKITNFDPSKKISENNPFDYWRQQTFYALLLESLDAVVENTSLLFPVVDPAQELFIDSSREDVRKQVIQDVEQVDSELTECINNNFFFPFKKGKYNGWTTFLTGQGNAFKPKIKEDYFFESIAEIEV